MDLSGGYGLRRLTVPSFLNHLNLPRRHATSLLPPILFILRRRSFPFRGIEAETSPSFRPSSSAALCLLNIRLRRRWRNAPPDTRSSLPPK